MLKKYINLLGSHGEEGSIDTFRLRFDKDYDEEYKDRCTFMLTSETTDNQTIDSKFICSVTSHENSTPIEITTSPWFIPILVPRVPPNTGCCALKASYCYSPNNATMS